MLFNIFPYALHGLFEYYALTKTIMTIARCFREGLPKEAISTASSETNLDECILPELVKIF